MSVSSHEELLLGPHPLSTTSSSMGNGNIRDVSSTVRGQMNPLLESGFHHHHGISSSVPNGFQSLLQYDSISNQSCLPESVQSQSHLKFDIHGSPNYQPHSLPDYHDGLTSSSSLCTMATSISQRKEIKENGQFCRVRPNGPTVELNQSGKCKLSPDVIDVKIILCSSVCLFWKSNRHTYSGIY